MRIQDILAVLLIGGFVVAAILAGQRQEDRPSPLVDRVPEWDVPVIPPERIWVDPDTAMEFIWVDGGCFEMGCGPWTSSCYDDEYPVHQVCLDGFWMGRFPVTQGQWLQVAGENPSHFAFGGDYPVESISWHDARGFVQSLNARGGEEVFHLPTEAQWEYACRSGGKPEKYSGGKDVEPFAWHRGNSGFSTQPVGSRRPNGLGIYDMSGNVFEWVRDEYVEDAYQRHGVHNPLMETPLGLTYDRYLPLLEKYVGVTLRRVIRGGSWQHPPVSVRCSHRLGLQAGARRNTVGVRLILELPWQPDFPSPEPAR